MDKKQEERFRAVLEGRRQDLLGTAKKTREQEMALDTDDLPDEMDLASSEYTQALTFRLRGREKVLLKKIDEALARLDRGEYGICEECDGDIAEKRLLARPVTTLCIACKEDQEKAERTYG